MLIIPLSYQGGTVRSPILLAKCVCCQISWCLWKQTIALLAWRLWVKSKIAQLLAQWQNRHFIILKSGVWFQLPLLALREKKWWKNVVGSHLVARKLTVQVKFVFYFYSNLKYFFTTFSLAVPLAVAGIKPLTLGNTITVLPLCQVANIPTTSKQARQSAVFQNIRSIGNPPTCQAKCASAQCQLCRAKV